MFRGNMIRWACVVATTVMAVSGCDCPGPNPPVSCTDTTITFETPTADQTVDSPFDVSFTVKNADGSAFNFERATLSVSGGASIEATSVSGNRATFTGVPGAAGAQSLVASIGAGTCSKSFAPQNITVRDACSNASVTAVSFPQDTGAPLGVLNATELPSGTDLQVQVDATCVSGVQVRIKRGTTEVSPLTSFTNGRATISLPGIPASDSERVDLFAELVRNGAPVNTMGGNPQASASIQVTRSLPSCSVTTMGSFGPMDDADTATAGFQMRVTGTMAPGSSGTLGVTGQTTVPVTETTGRVSADFTLSSSGVYIATLTCTDASGNSNFATGSFTVDFDPPTVAIVSPAVVDGGATMTATQSPLVVVVSTNAEDGSLAQVTRNGVPVGTVTTVQGGMVTLQVPFATDGTYTIGVTVTDAAGNATTVNFVVTVALSGCGADFSRPATCPAFLTPAQLAGGMYSFQTTSRTLCANQPAALFRSDLLADGGMSAESPAGTATLTAAGIAQFAPVTLASGDYLFRAAVTNVGADAGVSQVTCQVTVDLDGPVITSPLVPTGMTAALINASQDTQPGTPGVQRALAFSARVPVGGRVDVCTTQATDPVTMASRPTSPECGTGWFALRQGVTSPDNGFTFPEGTYDIKIVIVGSGLPTAPASAPVSLVVDGVRPCVTALSRRLPQDTNMDGRLNLAELAGAQPRLEFSLGCGDTSAALAATSPVVIRDVVGGALGAVRASTATATGNTYTVTLTDPYTAETDLELFVQLTDLANNQNSLAAMNDPARFSLRIDPIAPTCNITSPTAALLGIAQVPSGNLDVLIATSADVGTNGVTATFTGQMARVLTANLSQAQTTYALTGDATYTIGATCTDASGNSTTATPRTTRVDLDAPTCNIVTPANPAVSSVNDVTTTVNVTGLANGDMVTITSSVAGIMNNVLTVSGSSATGLIRYSNGAQMVSASASDTAGNTCVAPSGGTRQIQLTVNSTSCNLDFTSGGVVITNANGSWINRTSASNPSGTSPVTLAIGATTSDCGMGRNVYLYQGPPSTTPTGTPQVTNASGAVSFSGTAVSEGQQWTVTIDNGAGGLTHRSFRVSFAMPAIAGISLQRSAPIATAIPVAANAPLIFGAAAGNQRVDTALVTDLIFGDLDGSMADAQFQLTLTGIDGARVGTANATLDVLEDSTTITPTIQVNATPFTPTLPRMSLQHRTDEVPHSLVIRVTSPAGNVFTSTHSTQVDVIAPAAPSVTQTLSSARAATVGLSWMPVYDDGMNSGTGGLTGGTPVAGYDVRWTTSSVPGNNSMTLETDYFGANSSSDGIAAWSASAINRPVTLPPLNTYFISVRARDEVGNYSTFTPPAPLANMWNETTLLGPVASSSFGQTTAVSSSINNDTVEDLIVTAPAEPLGGAVYVYFGGASFASQAGCPAANCQRLGPSDTTSGSFGSDLSTGGNVGDVAGELKTDVLVAQLQSTAPNNAGRVVLYFGSSTAGLVSSDAIEFRGDATYRIGFTARIIRDLNGDGLDEIAIAAPSATVGGVVNRGRIFIFRGRTRTQWAALRTATDAASMVPYVPINGGGADHVIDGPNPLLATAGNAFGQNRHGFASVGDLNGDSVPDLGIPNSRPIINRYRVISGAAIVASSPASPLDATTAIFEVTEPATTETTVTNGLGAAVVTGKDVIDSSANDLVASFPSGGRVHLYSNPLSSASNPAPVLTIQGPTTFGFVLSAGSLNSADTSIDLVVPLGLLVSNEAWVLYRRGTGFDSAIGTGPAFWVSRFQGSVITGSTNTALGRGNSVGDLDAQSGNDLVLGDERANLVKVWR